MTTIIVGSGIVGLSTAFYLAKSSTASSTSRRIILIDTSRQLFTCASGRAAGFLNRSWFDRPSATLAELSFLLHEELAEIYDGKTRWGYRRSRAWTVGMQRRAQTEEEYRAVTEERLRKQKANAIDTGTSSFSRHHSQMNEEEQVLAEDAQPPDWIFCDREKTFQIAGPGECAQVNPRQLCEFLLEQCIAMGVEVLHPYHLSSLTVDEDGMIVTAVLRDLHSQLDRTVANISNVVVTAGAWTGRVFGSLFPDAEFVPAISSLAGFSMTLESPLLPYTGPRPVQSGIPTPTSTESSISGFNTGCFDMPEQVSQPEQDSNQIRDALFVRSSGLAEWSPEIFSRSNGEIYIAGLNEQGFHPLGSMLPSPSFEDNGSLLDEIDLPSEGDESKSRHVSNFSTMKSVAQGLLGPNITVLRRSVCLRPVTPGGEPIIGEVPPEFVNGTKGVYICAGHGPWGISLSLGSGKVMAELLTDGKVRSADISRLTVL
ncbi:FAD dependent oxidoreductase [Lipomyces tetrasporus]|uniref:FAD dependent oxidoreductase n=1 Tax=Lipomyces tetrasporus TaxID=54092 RepID=A0AAD7VR64_9ASCO|nr:FAD dependent oxidoreductase [Lipomyces tetrasporus]KAJ8098319.1 FAD dependent oxidoreductase [Lipomyces tetrasporus]